MQFNKSVTLSGSDIESKTEDGKSDSGRNKNEISKRFHA